MKFLGESPITEKLSSMLDFFQSVAQKSIDRVEIEKQLKSGKCLVKFFTPECQFCRNLARVWNELEVNYASSEDLTLVSINCKQQKKLCNKYFPGGGYPTIYWFVDGVLKEKFTGSKSFGDLQDFITSCNETKVIGSRVKRSIPAEERANSGVFELKKENYYTFISTNCSFVEFYMPGCSACQKINETWYSLAESVASYENIKVARINCNNFAPLCLEEANGCPTLSLFSNGKRLIKDYYRDMTIEGLKDCILSNCKGGQGEF